jgi:hypothetical protein
MDVTLKLIELAVHIPILYGFESIFEKLNYVYKENSVSVSFFTVLIRYFVFLITNAISCLIVWCLSILFTAISIWLVNLKPLNALFISKLLILMIQPFFLSCILGMLDENMHISLIFLNSTNGITISHLTLIRFVHFFMALVKIYIYNDVFKLLSSRYIEIRDGCEEIQQKKISLANTSKRVFFLAFYSMITYFIRFFPFSILPIDSLSLLIYDTFKNIKVVEGMLSQFFKDNIHIIRDLKKTSNTFECLPYYAVIKLAIVSGRFLFNYCGSIDDQIQNHFGYNDENLFGKMCSLSVLLPIKVKFELASPKNEICLKYTPFQCINIQSNWFEPKLTQNFDNVYSSFIETLLVSFSKNIVCLACLDYLVSNLFCFLGRVVNKILNYDHLELMNCLVPFKMKRIFFWRCFMNGSWNLKDLARLGSIWKALLYTFVNFLYSFVSYLDRQLMVLASSHNHIWKHLRLLSVCILFIALPTFIIAKLINNYDSASFFITILIFCIFVIASMSISIATYLILNMDLELFNTDNAIFYMKLLHCFIIVAGCFVLFLNGIYILFFESFGIFRLFSVATDGIFAFSHAYENWNEYKRRKLAVSKIHDLPEFNIVSFTDMKTKQNSIYLQIDSTHNLNNQSIQSQFGDYQNEA